MKKNLLLMRMFFLAAFGCLVLLVLLASFLGCSGMRGFIADQCSQLRVVWIFAFALLLLPLLILRSRLAICLAVLGSCLNLAALIPSYIPRAAAEGNSNDSAKHEIVLVTINLYGAHNRKYKNVVDFVKQKKPDIFCLNEINKPWLKRLNEDLPEYKYKFDEGISGGSAIYSRIPIEQVIPRGVPQKRRYGVRGTVRVANQQVMIIAEHPPSPSARNRWKNRNLEFDKLVADTESIKTPLIIIGDLNSTSWSPFFQNLLRRGNLLDSEQGYGVQPSWSTKMVLMPPMVPIDHCLTSNHFVVLQRSIGPNVGSDHLPVYVKLRLV